MSIIDYENELADKQAVTATAATTNAIDFGAAKDAAKGNPLMLEIICDEAAVSGGSTTVDFQLEFDTTDSFTPDAVADLAMGVAKADLVAGAVIYRGSVPEVGDYRYMQGKFTVNTANLTAGKFSWRLVPAFQSNV